MGLQSFIFCTLPFVYVYLVSCLIKYPQINVMNLVATQHLDQNCLSGRIRDFLWGNCKSKATSASDTQRQGGVSIARRFKDGHGDRDSHMQSSFSPCSKIPLESPRTASPAPSTECVHTRPAAELPGRLIFSRQRCERSASRSVTICCVVISLASDG